MTKFAYTYDQIKNLKPCSGGFSKAAKLLGGKEGWGSNLIDVKTAVDSGIDFDDLIWVAADLARKDKDIERRLRLWATDCAAHVLHIYEESETNNAPREAIIAARKHIHVEISAATGAAVTASSDASAWAASDAASAAAWAGSTAWAGLAASAAAWAARGDERKWQAERFILWFLDEEPECWPLPGVRP